jgi:hypothetical protein
VQGDEKASADDNDYEEDSDFAEDNDSFDGQGGDIENEIRKRLAEKEEVGVTDAELEDLLPPSSFGSDPIGAGRGARAVAGAVPRTGGGAVVPSAVAAKRQEDRYSNAANNGPRSAGAVPSAPVVRSSPLVSAPTGAVDDDYAAGAANYQRKGFAPSVVRPANVRIPTPSGAVGKGADPDGNNVRGGGMGMEVVGMRHARSPAAVTPSSGNPRSAPGAGANLNNNGAGGADSEAKRVADLLDTLLSDSLPSRTTLAQRLQSLKLLRMLWERGEVNDCVDHLAVLSDALAHSPAGLTTLADFFDAVELRGNGLNLDSCVRLLPILESMVASGPGFASEHVMYATFKALATLAEGYGDLIRNTRATIVVGGVDLSRETRLNKCNTCHAVFCRLGGRVEQLRRQFRASRTTVDILDVYADQCTKYFQ